MSANDGLSALDPDLDELDNLEPYDDDDDDDEDYPRRRRLRLLPVLAAVLAFAGAAGIVWFGFNRASSDVGEIPLITAQEEPAKVRPEAPGGLNVPYQDVAVLNEDSSQQGQGERSDVEVLLPPSENPMPLPPPPSLEPASLEPAATESAPPSPTAGGADSGVPAVPTVAVESRPLSVPQAPALPPADVIPTNQSTTAALAPPPVPDIASNVTGDESALPQPPSLDLPATDSIPALPPLPTLVVQDDGQMALSPAPAAAVSPLLPQATGDATTESQMAPQTAALSPAPAPAAAPAPAGAYKSQVAAFRRQQSANLKANQMRNAYSDLFGPLPLNVVQADLGQKGIWFRVQAGAFAARGDAASFCQELKRRGERDCRVAR